MKSVSSLKNDLMFNKSLDEIVNVLKLTTSLQFRQLQSRQEEKKDFLNMIDDSFSFCDENMIGENYLINRKEKSPKGIVVITSDEGFLGELNTSIINAGLKLKQNEADELIVLGKRGAQYLEDINEFYLSFSGISEKIEYKESDQLKKYLFNEYKKRRFNEILIVYADFLSIAVQNIKVYKLLPFSLKEIKSVNNLYNLKDEEILIEPSYDKIVEELVSLRLGYVLYNIFYSSKLSEFAARLMHLEKSSEELSKINSELSLEYFKNLHLIADRGIREMLSSRILWKK